MSGLTASPPRVAVLTSVHSPSDTRVFYRQATSMRAAGFDVLLIAPGAPKHPVNGVRFDSLPTIGGRLGRPLRWPILMWKAIRSKADLYHFHDPELLPFGLLLKWLTRRPVIYDSHEYLQESILTKHWVPRPLRRPVASATTWIERLVAGRLDAVVGVTDNMSDRFRQFQREVITVKNLPAPPDLPANLPERGPVVIHAGLMNIERGLDILFETASLVRKQVPRAEFHILGPVEWQEVPPAEEFRPAAEWEAAGVRFLGEVPSPEVARYLTAASIGWLPRNPAVPNNLLAWPNKLVEYMVVGLPIVASDLPTQASVIYDAGCGVVVEPLSPSAHAAAIVDLLNDTARAHELGENGRRTAREKYTWEGEAARLEALYRRLLAKYARS